jgi:tetratricopeptide (TPR) repeat protein
MLTISKYRTLSQANDSFLKSNYKEALEKFAMVLQEYPHSKEAYNGVILSEMALSGEAGAEALYDYYELLKEEDKENADNIINDILQNMDGAIDKLNELLFDPLNDVIEAENGILYKDFKNLVIIEGDFKKIFENIMFSTRVIITKKDDFVDFLDSLIKNGFTEMAFSYLESAINTYSNDQQFIKLLEKLSKGKKT